MRNISKLIFVFSNFINKILKIKIISNQEIESKCQYKEL